MTNASTAETFFVGPTRPSTFSVALAQIVPGFGENLPAVSVLQTVQFSIIPFHEFVTTGMVVAVFIAQFSHHHWSKTAGATVDDCYNVSLQLCIVWEQVLLRCQLFLKICGAHGDQHSQSHVFRQLVSSAFSVSLFKVFPGLDGVREVVYFGNCR